ncbi:MAG: hypothetical protein ACRDGG_03235 [Anaerolineae bacterium]
MAKRRVSLKGRGVDILLGGSSAAEPETPVTPAGAPGEMSSPAFDAAAMATDLSAAASTPLAALNPFAEPAPAAVMPNPFAEPVSPELTSPSAVDESAVLDEAVRGQPPTPVATSLPAEDQAWLADEAPAIPEMGASGSPAVGEPVSAPLPADPTLFKAPKIGGLSMSIPVISGPESFQPSTGLTQPGLRVVAVSDVKQVATDAEVLKRIGPERAKALSQRVDDLYAQIANGAIGNSDKANEAMSNLRTARDKELEDPRQFDEAEYLVNLAQYVVNHEASIAQVRQWSYTWGVVVFIYGLVWLAVFGTGLGLGTLGLVQSWLTAFKLDPDIVTSASGFFAGVMAGGLGGILGLLYSLFKHVAIQQDFDRQFLLWYFVQPFMGMLMGAIVHLFLVAGLFQLLDATGSAFQAIGALVAIAAAFRQNYVYAWLESLLKSFQRRSDEIKAQSEVAQAAEAAKASVKEEVRAEAAGPSQPVLVAMPASDSQAMLPSEPAGVG